MARIQTLFLISGAASLLLHAHDDRVEIQKQDGSARISRSASDSELQTARAVTGPWSTALDQSNPVDQSTRIDGAKFFRAASIAVMPEGFTMERVVGGLTYATSVAWDNEGNTYLLEAGGTFVEEAAAARIMRVSGGEAAAFIDLEGKVAPP